MRVFIYIISMLVSAHMLAQHDAIVRVNWQSEWYNQPFELSTPYKTSDNSSIEFDQLKMYVSGFRLLNNDKIAWEEKSSFHLLDFGDTSTTNWRWSIPTNIDYTKIQFTFGIDSLTQVSGVQGGPLDPTTGMYWTWQTGYINFKLEGKSDQCPSRLNQFQLHIGGYAFPHNTSRQITLAVNDKQNLNFNIPLNKLVDTWDLTTEHHIMSPGEPADTCAEILYNIIALR